MKIELKHTRAARGFDVDVTVTAESKETISHVTVSVNGFSQCEESPADGTRSWHRTLPQQGHFPGRNEVVADVLDQDGNQSSGEDAWG